MKQGNWLISLAAVALVTAGCGSEPERPDVTFAAFDDDYASKMDFARIEYEYPLTIADRMKLTPENIATLSQEEVDQVYARLTAGPIPDGAFEGDLFFPQGSSGAARLVEIVKGEDGGLLVNLRGLVAKFKVKKLETLGRILWKGKVFYRDDGVLRNRIEDLALLSPLIGDSPLDALRLPKIEVDGKDSWLLFPAKLYCGQSLIDGRRESIIIDYAFTDEIDGYSERPDYLAGRNAFMVRDEIRMVRPGFYLGRAYLHRFFVLNFTLYNEEIAERDTDAFFGQASVAEDCWPGEQKPVMAAAR